VNDFSRRWHGHEDELTRDEQAQQQVRAARRTGDLDHAPVYAGEAVGLVTRERSATDVVREMTADAEQALREVSRLLT
jgi:nitronate monooxygenase